MVNVLKKNQSQKQCKIHSSTDEDKLQFDPLLKFTREKDRHTGHLGSIQLEIWEWTSKVHQRSVQAEWVNETKTVAKRSPSRNTTFNKLRISYSTETNIISRAIEYHLPNEEDPSTCNLWKSSIESEAYIIVQSRKYTTNRHQLNITPSLIDNPKDEEAVQKFIIKFTSKSRPTRVVDATDKQWK